MRVVAAGRSALHEEDVHVNEPDLQRSAHDAVRGAPNGYFVVVPASNQPEAVDLRTLLLLIRRRWRTLAATLALGAAIAAGISLVMHPVYRVQMVLAPKMQGTNNGLSALTDQLGGLAALAGVDVSGLNSRKEEFFAAFTSRSFARDFIVAENLLPILFEDRWDAAVGRWRAGEKAPTLEDGVKKFTEEVREIAEDRKTGMVTLVIEWGDAALAARWANRMVQMLNERLRKQAIGESEHNIEYLNQELAKTNVVELRQAIYRLIQEQVHTAMLANVQRDYAFRVIDPAVRPEKRERPKRTMMTLVGAVLGFTIGMIAILASQRVGKDS